MCEAIGLTPGARTMRSIPMPCPPLSVGEQPRSIPQEPRGPCGPGMSEDNPPVRDHANV